MYAELRHLDGACAGQTRIVRKEFATIGRHPSADVQFDPEQDLDVSGRHAALFHQGGGWLLRDLGSSNGTWVNGERIKGDRPLSANDVIRFGGQGPRLVFLSGDEAAAVPETRRDPAAPGGAAPRGKIPLGSTTQRIKLAAERQTAPWRRATVMLAVLLVVGTLAAAWAIRLRTRALETEREALLARTDSLLRRLGSASTSVAALQSALREAEQETQRLRAAIALKPTDTRRLDSLALALTATGRQHEAVLRVASLDAGAIGRGNSDAVGMVLSEFPDGHRVAGTGFSVRAHGDTGWIVTSRHLVTANGARAARLGMIFNGSKQNFRAVLLATADSADLALLSVRVRGGVPVVHGVGALPAVGDPVALLGFPHGFDFPGSSDWRRTGVSVSSFAGTVRAIRGDAIEVDAYGAGGSSGSPLFNAAGEVVGVIFGGDPRTGGRVVYAVPAQALGALLKFVTGAR